MPWPFNPARPLTHPYVSMRRSSLMALALAWALFTTVAVHAHGVWAGLGAAFSALLTLALGIWGWPWLFYPWARVVQWRVRMNAKVLPDWPGSFSAFTRHWKPVVDTAWSDMDDVRAWLTHHAPVPPEWLVHEEQNIPEWARMSRSGTCLEEQVEAQGPVLRLWLVLDETSTLNQPYFRTCRAQGMPLAEIIYGMIAHEMGHAVDVVMRRHFPEQSPFSERAEGPREAVADVWEALSTFYPVDATVFAQRVSAMAQARLDDRPRNARGPLEHDTARHLRALLDRPDVHDVRRVWPLLPVAVRMRWVWTHVAGVEGFGVQGGPR